MSNTIIKNQDTIDFTKHPIHRDVFTKVLSGNDENGRLSAHLIMIMPGGEIVPHTHDVVEVFYITKGHGSALINGERKIAEKGTIIIAPSGSQHGLINEGEDELELFSVFSPGLA